MTDTPKTILPPSLSSPPLPSGANESPSLSWMMTTYPLGASWKLTGATQVAPSNERRDLRIEGLAPAEAASALTAYGRRTTRGA